MIGLVDGLVLAVIVLYIALCPFTKVEESFNMQAMHDILEHGTDFSKYDHLSFPGVVPRSFIGALTLSIFAAPFEYVLGRLTSSGSKYHLQLVCRFLLGLFSWTAYVSLRHSIARKFSDRAATFFGILTCLQFHIPFYASRALPNVYALIFVQYSFSMWLQVSRIDLQQWCSLIDGPRSGALPNFTLRYRIFNAHFSM
jgi:alpha-1,6-mannosyltransferase